MNIFYNAIGLYCYCVHMEILTGFPLILWASRTDDDKDAREENGDWKLGLSLFNKQPNQSIPSDKNQVWL